MPGVDCGFCCVCNDKEQTCCGGDCCRKPIATLTQYTRDRCIGIGKACASILTGFGHICDGAYCLTVNLVDCIAFPALCCCLYYKPKGIASNSIVPGPTKQKMC